MPEVAVVAFVAAVVLHEVFAALGFELVVDVRTAVHLAARCVSLAYSAGRLCKRRSSSSCSAAGRGRHRAACVCQGTCGRPGRSCLNPPFSRQALLLSPLI